MASLLRVPKTNEDPRRMARSVNRITADTITFSIGSAGTKTYTVPAAGAGSVDICLEILRAILDELAKKGVVTLTKT